MFCNKNACVMLCAWIYLKLCADFKVECVKINQQVKIGYIKFNLKEKKKKDNNTNQKLTIMMMELKSMVENSENSIYMV